MVLSLTTRTSSGMSPQSFAQAIRRRDYDYLLDVRTPADLKQPSFPRPPPDPMYVLRWCLLAEAMQVSN